MNRTYVFQSFQSIKNWRMFLYRSKLWISPKKSHFFKQKTESFRWKLNKFRFQFVDLSFLSWLIVSWFERFEQKIIKHGQIFFLWKSFDFLLFFDHIQNLGERNCLNLTNNGSYTDRTRRENVDFMKIWCTEKDKYFIRLALSLLVHKNEFAMVDSFTFFDQIKTPKIAEL